MLKDIRDKMNRKIRFPLRMFPFKANETDVRSLKELKAHYDHKEVVDYFLDHKLIEWLQDRYYNEQAEALEGLFDKYRDEKDPDKIKPNLSAEDSVLIQKKLCEIFDIENLSEDDFVDVNERNQFNEFQDDLEQLIEDDETLKNLEFCADSQERFLHLLKKKVKKIYLFVRPDEEDNPPRYRVPKGIKNIKLIGVDKEVTVEFEENPDENNITLRKIEKKPLYREEKENDEEGFIDNILNFFRWGDDSNKHVSIETERVDGEEVKVNRKYISERNSVEVVKEKLVHCLDAGLPLILLNTFEEDKVDDIVDSVRYGRRIIEWNIRGLVVKKSGAYKDGLSLADALDYFMLNDDLCRSILVIKDAQELLKNDIVAHRLKYLAQMINEGKLEDSNIIVIGQEAVVPRILEHYLTIIDMGYLSQNEIKKILDDFCDQQKIDRLEDELKEELSFGFKGLSEFEIVNILALAMSGDNEIDRKDTRLIREQKKQLIRKSGILEMITVKEDFRSIGGLEHLKTWLKRKAKIFKDVKGAQTFGVDTPKGVLIAGMPGCGKSLTAKATAHLLGIPLLRLDMGRIMGKYVGESETNMRRAIAISEAIAPCVLWIDELEKVFAGISGDGAGAEVTTRLFGAFLTWLQEKKSLVFVVATANDITKMPPELLRKGRFDEVFYITLPSEKERESILKIHVAKRRPEDMKNIDWEKLVVNTKGYCGADLEGVVKDGVERAFTSDKKEKKLTTDDIMISIKETCSLSTTMGKSLEQMKKVYEDHKFKKASAE